MSLADRVRVKKEYKSCLNCPSIRWRGRSKKQLQLGTYKYPFYTKFIPFCSCDVEDQKPHGPGHLFNVVPI